MPAETADRNSIGTATQKDNKPKAKRSRKHREPPRAYKSDELKEPAFQLPKVAQRGVSIDKLEPGDLYAFTSDGESLNIKINKSQSRRAGSKTLFDSAGLTVYEYVF